MLDEGHAIRNGKSKVAQCVKSLKANHRLILTGTPIQVSYLNIAFLHVFLVLGWVFTREFKYFLGKRGIIIIMSVVVVC